MLWSNITAAAAAAMAHDKKSHHWIDVGFGTAGLGEYHRHVQVVTMALEEGFRKFDTAEADLWYNQKAVGEALEAYFTSEGCVDEQGQPCVDRTCHAQELRVSTKVPPWSLTSAYDMRHHAANSRQELVGFCEHHVLANGEILPFTLDVYYIHAPECWNGWHPRCDNPPPTLNLKDAWKAMEEIVGHDQTVRRIGLSNVHPPQLLDLISWIQERQAAWDPSSDPTTEAPPRLPDAVQAFADPIRPAKELREICDLHGIEFVSYSTLGTQHRGRQNPVLKSPIVQDLANQYQRSTAEIVLQWARQHGMSVIPRSSQRAHIQELANLLKQDHSFVLSDHDMQRMDSLENSI